MPDAKIKISSEYDPKGIDAASDGLNKVGQEAKKSQGLFGALSTQAGQVFVGMMSWSTITNVVQRVWGAVKDFAISSISEWGKQESAIAKLNQALKNQGIYSKATSKDLQDYSSELQNITIYADDVISSGMATLVNFGLQGKQLKEVTKAALDFAAASGTDVKTAIDLVAKSVGSTTNALQRYGITVDTSATKTEKADQVVREISKLFGGQASAAADTYEGRMQQLNNTWGDLQEEVGKELTPIVQQFTTSMVDGLRVVVGWFNGLVSGIKDVIDFGVAIDKATGIFSAFGGAVLRGINHALTPLAKSLEMLGNTIKWVRDRMNEFTAAQNMMTDAARMNAYANELEAINKLYKVGTKEWEEHVAAAKKYYFQIEDNIKIDNKLAKKQIDNQEDVKKAEKEKADAVEKENKRIEKNTDDTAKLMAQSFRAAATDTQNAWDNLATNLTDTIMTNAFKPMAAGLNDMLGNFGDVGTIIAGGVGGVIGSAVSGFLGLLGEQSKSVAEYTQEAYNEMVDKTNEKLEDIGREKTEAEKAITLAESITSGMDSTDKISESAATQSIANVTGINIAGMTKKEALTALYGNAASLPTEYDQYKKELAELSTDLGYINEHQQIYSDYLSGKEVNRSRWAQLDRILRDRGYSLDVTELAGQTEAVKNRIAELNNLIGTAELEYAIEQQKYGGKIAALAEGGVVTKPTIALIGEAGPEAVIPMEKISAGTTPIGGITIQINEGAFTANGVNFTNESQKRAVAKEMASYILAIVNGNLRAGNSTERKV